MRGMERSGFWMALLLAGILAGCATTPGADTAQGASEQTESDAAESLQDERDGGVFAAADVAEPVARSPLAALAEARGDVDMAVTDIRMAEARGLVQPDARSWLEQARAALADGDAEAAGRLAREAGAQARASLDGYYADQAEQRIALLRRDYAGKMSSAQAMRLDSAESALKAGKSEVALMLVGSLVDEVAPNAQFDAPRTSNGQLTRVVVREGDTLSAIAARPEVYGNADLWPLLLKANRDKFLRVDEVPVGVELIIPRNASQQEIEQAKALTR